MQVFQVTDKHDKLHMLVDDVNQNHSPIQIASKNGNGILIAEDDWKAIEETLYLYSVPGLVESILEAHKEPLEEGTPASEIEW